MIPKIKTEYLKNDFYTVIPINQTQSVFNTVDFQISNPTPTAPSTLYTSKLSTLSTLSTTVITTNVSLKPLIIPISANFNNINQNLNIYSIIKKHIDEEFFKKLTEFGEIHRNLDIKFDLYIKDTDNIDKYNSIINAYQDGQKILNKITNASHYIASQGRVGPGQWIIGNRKTYNYLLKYMSDINLTYNSNNQLMIGKSPFIINNTIEDDIVLVGRKNLIDQPGIHCVILTDNNGCIDIKKASNSFSMTANLMLYYALVEVGSQPFLQYFKMNTKSLSYYRYKKLEKINKIYG